MNASRARHRRSLSSAPGGALAYLHRLKQGFAAMTLRRRITMVSAIAVAIAILLASTVTYLLASRLLHSQIDQQLESRYTTMYDHLSGGAAQIRQLHRSFEGHDNTAFGKLPPRPSLPEGYQQVVSASGHILYHSDPTQVLPITPSARVLASHDGKTVYSEGAVAGIPIRILTGPLRHGEALEVAQPLSDLDEILAHLRLILALLAIGGIALAAALGRLISGTAMTPVRRLTELIEHVTDTQDLSQHIEPVGDDEIGRLALGFNAMLDALGSSMAALDASVHAQRQLVADASHELRTPVTSLRTNIEILQLNPGLDPEERQRLLVDVVEQTEELTMLVNDLIDLARGEEHRAEVEDLRLDVVVAEALERARRHAPATPIYATLDPTVLPGVPERLGRAVNNLIDNAIKYSPPGQPVEIELGGGELTVRDHGPGIAPEDLPNIFDRFYRGLESRGRPGSGLGLAIVRQVIEQHRGEVSAEAAPGGGTLMRVRLPGAEPSMPAPELEHALPYSPA